MSATSMKRIRELEITGREPSKIHLSAEKVLQNRLTRTLLG